MSLTSLLRSGTFRQSLMTTPRQGGDAVTTGAVLYFERDREATRSFPLYGPGLEDLPTT